MKVGYARVSTYDQNPDLQKDALLSVGCEKIFIDKISGTVSQRPELTAAKKQLRPGDTLVVWRLDRLGRSIRDLIDWISSLEKNGVAFKSLQESIDTTTTSGKLIFHIFAALAEFERNLIKERTQAGLVAARSRGRLGGRPPVLNPEKQKLLIKLYNEKKTPIKTLCEIMGISKLTLYKYVKNAV